MRQNDVPALFEPHERPDPRHEGRRKVLLDGEDLYANGVDVVALRRRVGMVFQKSNPFPKSVFDSVAYGLRINGIGTRSEVPERVEMALQRAALWDEVKDRLRAPALALSGGQQQRLCIARASRSNPRCFSWTSRRRRSIRSRRKRSKS